MATILKELNRLYMKHRSHHAKLTLKLLHGPSTTVSLEAEKELGIFTGLKMAIVLIEKKSQTEIPGVLL